MLLNIKFSVTRSVEAAYLTAVIMSGLDKKKWMAGLVLGQVLLFHGFYIGSDANRDHTDHTTYCDRVTDS